MSTFVSAFLYIIFWYTLMGIFQYWISDFFFAFWNMIWYIKFPFNALWNLFGVTIPSYVFLLYWSLIFILIYSVLHKLYLSVKK